VRAKANQSHGQTAPGKTLIQNSGEAIRTDKEAAAIAGVSHDTYAKGKAVLANGTPELIDAVRGTSRMMRA
jgi:hypothetical protein